MRGWTLWETGSPEMCSPFLHTFLKAPYSFLKPPTAPEVNCLRDLAHTSLLQEDFPTPRGQTCSHVCRVGAFCTHRYTAFDLCEQCTPAAGKKVLFGLSPVLGTMPESGSQEKCLQGMTN